VLSAEERPFPEVPNMSRAMLEEFELRTAETSRIVSHSAVWVWSMLCGPHVKGRSSARPRPSDKVIPVVPKAQLRAVCSVLDEERQRSLRFNILSHL
jgi:hypothetical protein